MDLDRVITQLRTYAPIFRGNVAGSADYATGLETVTTLPLPAAYVYPLEDTITESSGQGGSLRETVEERIAIVVEVDNSTDRRGQAAVMSLPVIKAAILKALLNWNPYPFQVYPRGMRYAGGHLLGMDRARLFWQFEMTIESYIDGLSDGWIQPAEPLEIIAIQDTEHPPVEVDIRVSNALHGAASINVTAKGIG